MNTVFAFSTAWRYATGRRKKGMMSFLSSISMAGLVVGISLLVVVMSVMNGFERELRERILNLVPQATIYEAGGIQEWAVLRESIIQNPHVINASPLIQLSGLLSNQPYAEPALIYGIDIKFEMGVSRLNDFLDDEAIDALHNDPRALAIGQGLAKKLGLVVNDEVSVIVPGQSRSMRAPKIAYFKVKALLATSTELDQSLVLIHLDSASSLSNLPAGRVDGLRLKLDDLFNAPSISYQLVRELGPQFYSSNWRRSHGNLYHAIKVSKSMVSLLMSLIVALAAFNVVSTLILVVIEKQSNIAILRTLGASSGLILKIFIFQGMMIGVGGIVIGLSLGVFLSSVLEPLAKNLQTLFRVDLVKSDVYPLSYLPSQIEISDLVQITVTCLVLVLIATIYPALKASKLQPAEALRYE